MKSLEVLVVVALFAGQLVHGHIPVKLNPEQMAKTAVIASECITQEKTSKEAVVAFSQGDFSKADKNLKCYSNCFLTKTGFLVDGVLQMDVVKSKMGPHLGEDKLKVIMEKCAHLKGSDNCETAFMLFECYHKEHADIM
uniref:Uncharacterized protein n=1 Tax=Stomoxys calcitrans TaxID=35570 RepID=A0A1I8NSP9_STOCA